MEKKSEGKISKAFDVLIEVINYIVISFALASVAMSLRGEWVSILFFYADVWITIKFGKDLKEITENAVLAEIIRWISVAAFIALVYFGGYVKGTVLPFSR